MQLPIIQIGNSKGIRIPKAILDQCQIEDEIDLEVQDGKIILERRKRKPRKGWDEAFRRMARHGEDAPLIDIEVHENHELEDWEW